MLKVYTGTLLPKYLYLDILYSNFGAREPVNMFGENHPLAVSQPFIQTVNDMYDADAVLIPYSLQIIEKVDPYYVVELIKKAKEYNKPVIAAVIGDSEYVVSKDISIVLRSAGYVKKMEQRDIIVPPSIPDIGNIYGVLPKQKGEVPTVAFCGYAGFSSITAQMKYAYKNTLSGIGALFSDLIAVRRQGIYFRKKAMASLSRSPRVQTHFITRPFYSGHRKTIGIDITVARREYIENMQGSDVALAPKGDGNYSLRFYEALALGRIPLLIDTDTALPGDQNWYKDVILRVSWKDIGALPSIITDWFDGISDDEFFEMQAKARALFVEKLYAPRFYEQLFTSIEQKIKGN